MPAVIAATCLLAACMCIAFGVVRIGTWLIDRREHDRARAIRDSAFVVQASAELAQLSARNAYFRRLEIQASKRGDLLTAAEFADQAEVRRG